MSELTTNELVNLLGEKQVRIVDVRRVDAYNGWRLQNEKRGGHIRGAKSFPAKWLLYSNWKELAREKQILPTDHIIVYGYDSQENQTVTAKFSEAGYEKVYTYDRFVEEWAANSDLPMEKLKRYEHLVYPEWIQTLIEGRTPPGHSGNKTVICHAHYRNRNAYLTGHIPGAIDMDTLALEDPKTWNRRSSQGIEQSLKKHGITSDTTVILYGKYLQPDNADDFPGSAAGHIAALRCAFIMMYAGVKDVRVLNGGFQSWEEAGLEIHTTDVHPTAAPDFGVKIPAHPELAVDTPEAKAMLKAKDAELVCVRSWPEYIGEVSGYNYIDKKGRIPGAVFGNCGSDAYHMENYRNPDHTTRAYPEIAERWLEAGITPDKHLAFYCGTGWRGSEAFFNAWLMGWPRVSVYDGGWMEWSNDPGNPYETGIPEGV